MLCYGVWCVSVTEKGFGVLESRLNVLEDAVKASHLFVEGGLHAINSNLDNLSKNPPVAVAAAGNSSSAISDSTADHNKKVTGVGASAVKPAASGSASVDATKEEAEKSISKNDERLAALKEFKKKQKNAKLQKGLFMLGFTCFNVLYLDSILKSLCCVTFCCLCVVCLCV